MAAKIVTLAVCAAILSACGPTVFDPPPGVDEAQFHRDNLECAVQAKAIVGDSFAFGPPLFVAAASAGHASDIRAAHDECMQGKSYVKHVGN